MLFEDVRHLFHREISHNGAAVVVGFVLFDLYDLVECQHYGPTQPYVCKDQMRDMFPMQRFEVPSLGGLLSNSFFGSVLSPWPNTGPIGRLIYTLPRHTADA